jgi:hypothetical protein
MDRLEFPLRAALSGLPNDKSDSVFLGIGEADRQIIQA